MLEKFNASDLMNVLCQSTFRFVGTKKEIIDRIEFFDMLKSEDFLDSYLSLGGLNASVDFMHDDGSQDNGTISIVDFRTNELYISHGDNHTNFGTTVRKIAHLF